MALLERVAHRELALLPRIFVLYTRGLVALEEERFDAAEDLLSQTEQAMQPRLGNPEVQGMLRDVWAFHALAFAGLGLATEARACFARARPLLEARRERELLDCCQAAV